MGWFHAVDRINTESQRSSAIVGDHMGARINISLRLNPLFGINRRHLDKNGSQSLKQKCKYVSKGKEYTSKKYKYQLVLFIYTVIYGEPPSEIFNILCCRIL